MKNTEHPSSKLTLKKERLVKISTPVGNNFDPTVTQPTSQSTILCLVG